MKKAILKEKINDRKQALMKLYGWISGRRLGFTESLFSLIDSADSFNRQRLRIVFAEEVGVFEEWQERGDKIFQGVSRDFQEFLRRQNSWQIVRSE